MAESHYNIITQMLSDCYRQACPFEADEVARLEITTFLNSFPTQYAIPSPSKEVKISRKRVRHASFRLPIADYLCSDRNKRSARNASFPKCRYREQRKNRPVEHQPKQRAPRIPVNYRELEADLDLGWLVAILELEQISSSWRLPSYDWHATVDPSAREHLRPAYLTIVLKFIAWKLKRLSLEKAEEGFRPQLHYLNYILVPDILDNTNRLIYDLIDAHVRIQDQGRVQGTDDSWENASVTPQALAEINVSFKAGLSQSITILSNLIKASTAARALVTEGLKVTNALIAWLPNMSEDSRASLELARSVKPWLDYIFGSIAEFEIKVHEDYIAILKDKELDYQLPTQEDEFSFRDAARGVRKKRAKTKRLFAKYASSSVMALEMYSGIVLEDSRRSSLYPYLATSCM